MVLEDRPNTVLETPSRIEPARLEEVSEVISDIIAELVAESTKLQNALNPKTAASLAGMVRIMNTYYSNLIEGHNTRPRDIERALENSPRLNRIIVQSFQIERALNEQSDAQMENRDLLIEAVSHVRVQEDIDRQFAEGQLAEPASKEFILALHRKFYDGATENMLRIQGAGKSSFMVPGEWRSLTGHDVAVGRHIPPSSRSVVSFMEYFSERYRFDRLGKAARILAIPAAHHRFNFIHPFPDGNGRVSRLMSHAMAHHAGIGAHGLWSISRGLARGLESRTDYKLMMDHADTPRQGDLDGRGNLSQAAFVRFIKWFLEVCLDQVKFMTGLFDLETLVRRLRIYVERSETLKPEAARLLEEALIRGQFERGDVRRITGLPERTARRVFKDVYDLGLLKSATPKGAVYLHFPVATQDILFPRLFAES
jgi:Fic family protein